MVRVATELPPPTERGLLAFVRVRPPPTTVTEPALTLSMPMLLPTPASVSEPVPTLVSDPVPVSAPE
jgi:hypothetical protein